MPNKLRLNQQTFKKTKGFTIIELVVVVVVMGILSAIVTLSYSSWKQTTITAQLKSDLSNASMAMENYRNFNNVYPSSIPDNMNPSEGVTLSGGSSDGGKTYCVSASSEANEDLVFHITSFNSNDPQEGACSLSATSQYTLTLTAGTGGTVSGAGTFDIGTVRTITATPSSYYSFSSWTGSTGCSGTASHTITMDANKSCTANFTPTAIATPSAPTVSASTVGATTTWSWGAASCPGNTARYQYRYTISPSGYDSGLVTTANTSVAFTTSTEGQTYAVSVQAQCYNPITSSSWSTAGSASYYRPLTGGTVTFNSGSGSWTAPAGVTSVTAYVWGAGGGGGTGCVTYGGGGGGAFATKVVSVVAGNSYNYSVGAGVLVGNGGDSWFVNSSTVFAKGGAGSVNQYGGIGGQASSCIPTTGAYSGGNGGNGDTISDFGGGGGGGAGSGGNGGNGGNANSSYGWPGAGGIGTYPGGNGGGDSIAAGGLAPGGGGIGTDAYDCSTGGDGANGRIILVW